MSLAEDLINGACCHWCGVYFEQEHGYPVLCNDCFDDDAEDSQEAGLQRAIYEEV